MDELYFDELKIKEQIETSILNQYNTDKLHWHKMFGNRDLKFYSSLSAANSQDESPQFPCAVLSISSEPDTTWANSSQIEEVSTVNFTIDIFTVKVNNVDKETLGSYLTNIVIKGLRNLSGNIVTTRNAPLINFDNSVYRRIIRGVFKYDNKTNTFYKGG